MKNAEVKWGKNKVPKTWTVRSKTSFGTAYTVSLDDDTFSCTCPDFQFRGGTCKHIRKIKMRIAAEEQKNKLPGAVI